MWVTGGTRRRVNQETLPMRIYIISKDGIALCREMPTALNGGEIVVASKEERKRSPTPTLRRMTAMG